MPSSRQRRAGEQPEVAGAAILCLLSDEAFYATGTFIDLAGGRGSQPLVQGATKAGHQKHPIYWPYRAGLVGVTGG
jgi:hypothetical protein